jgi:hypothetical protein
MRRLLFVIMSLCFSYTAAHAQYTCNDRDYLRQLLADLDRTCGGGNSICRSSPDGQTWVAGGNLKEAIDSCKRLYPGWERGCSQNVRCENAPLCHASPDNQVWVAGGRVNEAIANCIQLYPGWERGCRQNVRCEKSPLCQASPDNQVWVAGETVSEAISNCNTQYPGWERGCSQYVRCN